MKTLVSAFAMLGVLAANALPSVVYARPPGVIVGRGMNDPRVPTPLGVRKPQNKRVPGATSPAAKHPTHKS